jgi:hypothetical protein
LAGKIVHIKPATEIELNDFIQKQSKIDNQTKNLDAQVVSGDEQKCNYTCIHLQGLPAYVTLQDLQYTFFNGLEFGTRGMQLNIVCTSTPKLWTTVNTTCRLLYHS